MVDIGGPAAQTHYRNLWAQRRFPNELARLDRLQRALEDVDRASSLAVTYIDQLTNADLVAKAQKLKKEADGFLCKLGFSFLCARRDHVIKHFLDAFRERNTLRV